MFKKILVALDHSKSDSVLLPRVKELCRLTNASLLLLHVSTGWKASWQRDLNLTDSLEMEEDRGYLREVERSHCQDRTRRKLRLDRDGHTRTSLAFRPHSWNHYRQGASRNRHPTFPCKGQPDIIMRLVPGETGRSYCAIPIFLESAERKRFHDFWNSQRCSSKALQRPQGPDATASGMLNAFQGIIDSHKGSG